MDGRRSGTSRWVRCSAEFNEIINECLGAHAGHQAQHPPGAFEHIFRLIIPKEDLPFGPGTKVSSEFLLGHNDYIMEEAFVYGVTCLSKWFGKDKFPVGLYDLWPPRAPSHLHVRPPAVVVDEEEGASPGAVASSSGRRGRVTRGD